MEKIIIQKPGNYDQLKIINENDLSPADDEAVVAVRAIGVNYADCVTRMGLYQSAKDYVGYPISPGFEVSGTILSKGRDVKSLEVGQRVIAVTRFNAYATQVKVPTSQIFPLPEELSLEEAAGFPTAFLTAWYALYDLGQVKADQKVLIHSAAGGVGGSLVQLAKAKGAHVTGVVGSSHKVEYAKSLGADVIIDKSTEDLWEKAEQQAPEGFHIILDANGISTLKQSYAHLRPTGKLIIYGFHTMLPRGKGKPQWLKLARDYLLTPRFNPISMTNENKSVLAFNLSYLFDEQDVLQQAMNELFSLLKSKKIQAPKIQCYPFADVADAHKALETAQTLGKLILTV